MGVRLHEPVTLFSDRVAGPAGLCCSLGAKVGFGTTSVVSFLTDAFWVRT
jgi:hypothetical protein